MSIKGGQVSSEFDLSNPSFSAASSVEKAIGQGTQVLMLAPNTGELDKALQVVQVNRKRLYLLGGDDVYTIKTLEYGRDAAAEMVVAVPWHVGAHPTSPFTLQSQQLWGDVDVNWRTALSYDATRAFIAALERNQNREKIQQALSSSDFSLTGASGKIQFSSGDRKDLPDQLVKIQSVPDSRSGTGYDFVPVP